MLVYIHALAALRTPVAIRGCVTVHTPTATELYFKDARALDHAGTRDLLNAMGKAAFIAYVEAWPHLHDLCAGVEDRTVLVTIDRRTNRVSGAWTGRPNDWSGRWGLRARLLATAGRNMTSHNPNKRTRAPTNGTRKAGSAVIQHRPGPR